MAHIPTRDHQSLFVRIAGRGQPVLLLHGMGMDSRHWLPFIWPHLHRFRFYMPDFRGAGRSAALRLNQTDIFQNHMEDVQDLIRHCGLQDFLLAGFSLGGSTALHLQRAGGFAGVRRYLHIDQSPCVGNREDWRHGLWGERQAEIFASLRQLEALLREHADAAQLSELPPSVQEQAMAVLADTLPRIAGKPTLRPLLQAASRWPRVFERMVPLKHLGDLRAILSSYLGGGHDYRPSLANCPVPVTVMVGMRSPLYHPQGQMAIAALVPQGRVVRLERSGHVPLTDQPLRFGRELGRFLRG
ncbi:MAG TPA: alpha/beta hydrolase [Solimonas sp.]|nr:alpha/beta hydrolase [Solimonas sp.]